METKHLTTIMLMGLLLATAVGAQNVTREEIKEDMRQLLEEKTASYADVENIVRSLCRINNTTANPYYTINESGDPNVVFIAALRNALQSELPFEFANIEAKIDQELIPKQAELFEARQNASQAQNQANLAREELALCIQKQNVEEEVTELEKKNLEGSKTIWQAVALLFAAITFILIWDSVARYSKIFKGGGKW